MHFSPFTGKLDNILLTIHNKMFRIGVKTYVGSENLKHTHIFFSFFAWRHTDDLSVAKGLKLPDLILSLLWLLKTHRGYKTFFILMWLYVTLLLLNFGLLQNFRDVTIGESGASSNGGKF